ncbi:MAG: MaoC family dehydratase [Janthinobacterium lividum]
MKFAEFQNGQQIEAGPLLVSETEIVDFASRFDPQWFHCDPERAALGRWSGLIASGWHTCALAMRLAYEGALVGSESFGSPGLDYVKWPKPVRPGDALTWRATVLDVRRGNSKPDLGILRWRWELLNQSADVVLDLQATSFFDLGAPTTVAATAT